MAIFDAVAKMARKLNGYVTKGKADETNNLQIIAQELHEWKGSPERMEAISGFLYYAGYHDILHKRRMAIGKGGEMVEVKNLPNRKDIDNQYAAAVDKKANYMLGKPISFEGDNELYIDLLQDIFNKGMMRRLKGLAKKSMNGAVGWVFPRYDEQGNLKFDVFPAYEVMPVWADAEHEELDSARRLYEVEQYINGKKEKIEKVEIYRLDGVYRYILEGNTLKPDIEAGAYSSYISLNGIPYNWEKIPLIAFKYNAEEIPLIRRVKGLQDALNELLSMFHNNMLEDNRNTILVIKNYQGTDLGEFRQNLSQYGAVKVTSIDGSEGGVEALTVEVNAENYKSILDLIKIAIIENARSFDGKMLQSGTPNQMNILSMYQDIDIDTNDFETEYQAALEELLYFINVHLSLTGKGDYFEEKVKIIFNRDMLMNEAEIMQTLTNAGVRISNRTLLSQVPFVDDVDEELEQLKKEQEEALEVYGGAFPMEGQTVPKEEENPEE